MGEQIQALGYLNSLKSRNNFWHFAARLLVGEKPLDDNLIFFLWQAIEQHLKDCTDPDEDNLSLMKEFVRTWIIRQGCSNNVTAHNFVRNKAAQVIALVFLRDYLTRWPTFFEDLMVSWSYGTNAIDNYLRVLKAITIEVADKDLSREKCEIERNVLVRNRMRETCMTQIALSWYQILKTKELYASILCSCLEVMSLFVSWIEIKLVANARFIPLLLELIKSGVTREAVVDCLLAIVAKGMEPLAKFELIQELVPLLEAEGVFEPVEDDQTDFNCKLSELLNNVGLNLMEAHHHVVKICNPAQMQAVLFAIESKIPLVTVFLGNFDDDVSAAVIVFAREYIRLLKGKLLTGEQLENVKNLLSTTVEKMKFDGSFDISREGETKAEFLEFRRQLKVLFDQVARLNQELVLEFTYSLVTNALLNWHTVPFQDVEIALVLLYIVGEVTGVAQFQPPDGKPSQIQIMMRTMVTCGVSGHSTSTVVLQYLETVVRYERFFSCEPEHIPSLLLTFLDHRGMRHPDEKVRSRCAFLFSKFIKALKCHVMTYTMDLLCPLRDLLVLQTSENSVQHFVTQDDQLFLYEAAGILIVSSAMSNEQKVGAFQELLHPVVESFQLMLGQLRVETDIQRSEKFAENMCHAMAVTSRASKAFVNLSAMKSCGCDFIFVHCLQGFLPCLQVNQEMGTLQAGMRQFLHRMVVCLEVLLVPFIPEASQGLLRTSNVQSIKEYLPLITQITQKFKKPLMPYMVDVFWPIVTTVFEALALPNEENDQEAKREQQILRRNYFFFLLSVVNEMTDILKSNGVKGLEQILTSVIRGAVDYPDPLSQKTCFTILHKLVKSWGDKNDPFAFTSVVMEHILPACFAAPMKFSFDLTDAQAIAALGEMCTCMKVIYELQGDDFILYLRNQFLPSLNLSPASIDKYCEALKGDSKVFKTYAKDFFLARS